MRALRQWSFATVLLVSGAWILFCLLFAAAWIAWAFFQLRGLSTASSGAVGAGAVSIGFSEAILLIPVVPPMLLVFSWLVTRW
jgi:hypothetical protein